MTKEQITAPGCWEHLVIALKLTPSQWASKAARDGANIHKSLKRTPIVGWQNNGLLELAEPIFAVRNAPRNGQYVATLRPDGKVETHNHPAPFDSLNAWLSHVDFKWRERCLLQDRVDAIAAGTIEPRDPRPLAKLVRALKQLEAKYENTP